MSANFHDQLAEWDRRFTAVRKSVHMPLFAKLRKAMVRVRAHPRQKPKGGVTFERAKTQQRKEYKPKAKPTEEKIARLPLATVRPDPSQHRKLFDRAKLQELADSIRETGQKTPIVVQPIAGAGAVKYQIIAGERRYRACQLLGLKEIKAIIRHDVTEESVLTEQVIENVNREQVTPMEEAVAYRQLADLFIRKAKRTKRWQGKDFKDPAVAARLEDAAREWVAKQTGKKQHHVTFYVKLTELEPEVQEMVSRGALTPRHGNILTRLTDNVTEPKQRRERLLHQVRMARHARAHSLAADILNGMITEYIRAQEQQVMFSEEEATGGERQVARGEQKAKIDRIAEAVADAIAVAFSEEKGAFQPELLTSGDLQVNLQKVEGAINTLGQIVGLMKQEMMKREAVEATKRRQVSTGGGMVEAGALVVPVATRSLFGTMEKSLATLEDRREALGKELDRRGAPLKKAHVRAHRRRLESGKITQVQAHETSAVPASQGTALFEVPVAVPKTKEDRKRERARQKLSALFQPTAEDLEQEERRHSEATAYLAGDLETLKEARGGFRLLPDLFMRLKGQDLSEFPEAVFQRYWQVVKDRVGEGVNVEPPPEGSHLRRRWDEYEVLRQKLGQKHYDPEYNDAVRLNEKFEAEAVQRGARLSKSRRVKAHPLRTKTGAVVIRRAHTDIRPSKATTPEIKKRTMRKYEACLTLRKALSEIDAAVEKDLQRRDTPITKVAAAMVALIRQLNLRVGSESMAQTHGTFGAASLRKEHIRIEDDTVRLQFPGKKGVAWDRTVADPALVDFLRQQADRSPGEKLFWYNDHGEQVEVDERVPRAYLQKFGVNPKDFRTYQANLRLFEELKARELGEGAKPSEVKKSLREAMAVVAEEMGHDPGTCRTSYIFEPLWRSYLENGGRLTVRQPFSGGALAKGVVCL